MAKSSNQKLKLLYLAQIFSRETDEEHGLSVSQIEEKLSAYGIKSERKTLYHDFEELRRFGLDIVGGQNGRSTRYYLGERDFELAELKLLVDSVQAAKFITERKSASLIRKLENLVSKSQAVHLQRQVVMSGRVKTMNESIYYNVDRIHTAIGMDEQIRFRYFQWNVKKDMELRKDGAYYTVSPWALIWNNEYYYLAAYDAGDGRIKHYRVDKMLRITQTGEKRLGKEAFAGIDLARYSRSLFGMFGGEEERVRIEAPNQMAGIFIDRFGKDVILLPKDEERFTALVDVAVSRQFLGWVFALGSEVVITGPESVRDMMKEEACRIAEKYRENREHE